MPLLGTSRLDGHNAEAETWPLRPAFVEIFTANEPLESARQLPQTSHIGVDLAFEAKKLLDHNSKLLTGAHQCEDSPLCSHNGCKPPCHSGCFTS